MPTPNRRTYDQDAQEWNRLAEELRRSARGDHWVNNEDWTVWGDQPEPIKEGTEEECKKFVEDNPDREDLYVSDPHGNEWEYYEDSGWLHSGE